MTTTRRKRDDTWVVKDDEFHPDPKVAAVNADRLALTAAARSNSDELARVEKRLEREQTGNERRALEIERTSLKAEAARIANAIVEHDKEKDA